MTTNGRKRRLGMSPEFVRWVTGYGCRSCHWFNSYNDPDVCPRCGGEDIQPAKAHQIRQREKFWGIFTSSYLDTTEVKGWLSDTACAYCGMSPCGCGAAS